VSTPAAMANHGTVTRLRLSDETLEIVHEQASRVTWGRVILGTIGFVLFGTGWLVAKTLKLLLYAGAWSWAAMSVGWRQARGEAARLPNTAELLAENDRLRKELARISPTMS